MSVIRVARRRRSPTTPPAATWKASSTRSAATSSERRLRRSGAGDKRRGRAGEAITYSYTTSGAYELTTVTNPGRGGTVYKHLKNMVITVTDPLGRVTSYDYDGRARKASETDGRGNTTRFEYDSAGNGFAR